MSWYRTGRVAVTNGSKTVTGVGTLWTTAVNAGDAFALVDANLNPTGAWYEVESVMNNTTLVLKQSYAGTTGSNNQYCVFNMVGNMTTPSFAQRLATFFASFQSLIDQPTATPTALGIPVADANGDIDSGWLKDASTTVKGVVEVGSNISVADGIISVPEASETVKGVVELATVAETTAGTAADKVITPSALNASPAMRISDVVYNGEDLTVKFASEIAGFDNVWAWIKSRITAGSYDGIHIADYIPFTITGGEQFQAQIAGIDTYYRANDVETGHHIDFISKDCYPTLVQWNTTNNNNGNATNAAPWMVSNIRTKLNTLVSSLPAGLQSVVATKRTLLETRYTSGSTLTSSTSWEWNDMGKLWLPSEYEVNGSLIWSGVRAIGLGTQYPIFANNRRFAIKGAGHNGSRAAWWLSTVSDGGSTRVCAVTSAGLPHGDNASSSCGVPLCFRIS